MKIAVGCDHAGFELKTYLVGLLKELGHQVLDQGCHSLDRVDYPDYAAKVSYAILGNEANLGLLVCGSGIGISIAANKVDGIRAALCHDAFTAAMSRAHNDANILCLGSRVIGQGTAASALEAFLNGKFEGGRHANRVAKIHQLEKALNKS